MPRSGKKPVSTRALSVDIPLIRGRDLQGDLLSPFSQTAGNTQTDLSED